MISIYQLKPRFQQLLLPILHQLHKQNVTANKITVAAIVWSALIAGFLFMSTNHPIYLLFVALGLLVRMALNALDGMMARSFNQQSNLGEVLNELGDVVSDTIIFCALFSFSYTNNLLVFLFIVLSIINEFSGVLAKLISGTRRYDGPMGKSDRALVIGLWCLAYFIFPTIGFVFNTILFVAIILLLISTYKRLSNAL